MRKIKEQPEDFIVNEMSRLELRKTGKYGLFSLQKKDINTSDAVEAIAKRYKLPLKHIGFAGNKDKKAVTFQFVSILNGLENHQFGTKNLKLIFLGFVDEPVRIGSLLGNQFVIRVYTDEEPIKRNFMPNYFGEQRFSSSNVDIGLAIVKKNFGLAVELIAKTNTKFSEFVSKYEHKNDFIGCLNRLPKLLLLFYVHAFQSIVFNRVLDTYIRANCEFKKQEVAGLKLAYPTKPMKNFELPVFGFASKLGSFKQHFEPILVEYEVKPRDFVIRELPWLSVEGTARAAFAKIEDLEITQINFQEYLLRFFLQKGSYATIAINSLF